MELVESYDQTAMVVIGGRSFPQDCLVEDEDAIRILIASTPDIKVAWWTQAHQAGAALIVCPDGLSWLYCTTEDFIEHRIFKPLEQTFRLPLSFVTRLTAFVGYRQYMSMRDAHRQMVRTQDAKPQFANIHTHSEMSPLDGLSTIPEIVDTVIEHGQEVVSVTDHGVCSAHATLQVEAVKRGIRPLFGIEAYMVPDRSVREGGQNYWHLILLAMNDTGLHNLWAASTEANRTGFYYKPRMDWEVLERHAEGLICSTACLRGPLAHPLLQGDVGLAEANLSKLYRIFPGRLYVELGVNQLPEQIKVNTAMVEIARSWSLPVIAAVDSHYPRPADYDVHQMWLKAQTTVKKDTDEQQDDGGLFSGHQEYHLMSRSEVHAKLGYLDESVVSEALDNTVTLAARCDAKVAGKTDPPIFSRPRTPDETDESRRQRDVDLLLKRCMSNWDRKVKGKAHPESEYVDRFDFEFKMFIRKRFIGYFCMVADYCAAAKSKPMIMGPSRGSGGASLVAYLADITEIDPIEADLLFARFMTEGRPSTDPPDFDLDFPSSQRGWLTDWIVNRWGQDHVVRVGTHTRLRNKGVIRDLARVLTRIGRLDIFYPDVDAICKIIEAEESDSSGLGKSWDEVIVATEDVMRPYVTKYPLLFDMAAKMVGRLKSYGRHPAGMVIAPDRVLTDTLPMRQGDDGQMVVEFDMHALAALGLLKFDLLTLRNLDTLQAAVDLISERRGRAIDLYDWQQQYEDPQVWDALCEGHTMGVFQAETPQVTKLVRRFQPRSISDLADVITLVRPGPTNSGLTETYLRRRQGLEQVTYPDPRLESVLARTNGIICYQEDVIATCRILAGYDDETADNVRKILGKKQIEKAEAEGRKFIPACVERGMQLADAEMLWSQITEFSRYAFGRAHAWAYAMVGFWTAWAKVHYTPEFMTAALSTVDKGRIPDFVSEARRMGFKVLPPDVNESGVDFRPYPTSVRYSLQGIKGIGPSATSAIVANQPYGSFDDFRAKMKGTGCHSDHIRLLVAVGAFDSLYPNRHHLEVMLDREASGESDRCVHKDDTVSGPNGLPCTFDWDSEPVSLTKAGKVRQPKAPPKRCTRACRHYTPPPPTSLDVEPYTPDDIRDKEMELLDVWLSSTPFDRIDPEDLKVCCDAEELDQGVNGPYYVAAIVKSKRATKDKMHRDMGFVTLLAQTANIDVVVFHSLFSKMWKLIQPGALCICLIIKTNRGFTLEGFMPCQ